MEETFEVFRARIIKPKGKKRNFKVTNSWGVYDAYKALRKAKWYDLERPLTEKEFYAIIRGINKLLAEDIIQGREVLFPWGMGKLELRKYKRGVDIVDGKLRISYVINWPETLKLWHKDPEERKKKTLLRWENPWLYHVKYVKTDADFTNKSFYQFALNSFIKDEISKRINEGTVDALW